MMSVCPSVWTSIYFHVEVQCDPEKNPLLFALRHFHFNNDNDILCLFFITLCDQELHLETMKVLLHYEDNEDTELWKSLKITLPKSWRNGPTSQLLGQFVESYTSNETLHSSNPLNVESLHLAVRRQNQNTSSSSSSSSKEASSSALQPLASDDIVVNCIQDRADVYVRHGASQTLDEIKAKQSLEEKESTNTKNTNTNTNGVAAGNTIQCTRFGCQVRFAPGGPYPTPCSYHTAPPVFHETAKFWSCCPHKKVYDWDQFTQIPGCAHAECCTDVKDDKDGDPKKMFLGGTDLREKAGEAVKLKSIDDFNKSLAAGGSEAAPVLDRLQGVLQELGLEAELVQQVVNGMRLEFSTSDSDESALLEAIKSELGSKLKACFKSIAAEQLRIK